MGKRKKLLITGAAGQVGKALRRYLGDRYDFRLLCYPDIPEVEPEDEALRVDLADYGSMGEVGVGIDAIVHLGIATPPRGRMRSQYDRMVLETNIGGTYNVFESARINGIRRPYPDFSPRPKSGARNGHRRTDPGV